MLCASRQKIIYNMSKFEALKLKYISDKGANRLQTASGQKQKFKKTGKTPHRIGQNTQLNNCIFK